MIVNNPLVNKDITTNSLRQLFVLWLLISLPVAPVLAKKIEDRRWIEVSTENFVVRTDHSEKKARELIFYMEAFRAAVPIITNIPQQESRVPMTIYAFDDHGDFARLGMQSGIAGFFRSTLRKNVIALRDTGLQENQVILHEYIHFLMRNYAGYRFPPWYSEGFAEYLSSAKIKGGQLRIGLANDRALRTLTYLPWLSFRKVLTTAYSDFAKLDREKRSAFYAQSWALVHYLHRNQDDVNPIAEALPKYFKLVENGTAEETAFEESFGIDFKTLSKNVKRYLRKGRFTYVGLRLKKDAKTFGAGVSEIPRHEIALQMGHFALDSSAYEKAKRLFLVARQAETL
ncbi:MAG: DUF1570 domain-containing protein, partial [Pseudomonadota bacterium]